MTIRSVRIYFYLKDELRQRELTGSHWGVSEWFNRRLKPIQERLRGPEAKGVDIMNLMLFESDAIDTSRSEWRRLLNTFDFRTIFDFQSLDGRPPIENIARLLPFYADIADRAPWPQARAAAGALREPLSELDRITLAPYLQWPRGEPISDAKARKLLKATSRADP